MSLLSKAHLSDFHLQFHWERGRLQLLPTGTLIKGRKIN